MPLKDSRGEITQYTSEKLEIFRDYFQKLNSLEEVDGEEMKEFLDKLIPQVAEEHAALLEASIGQEEVMEALKAWKMNTDPGPGGFTPEFYKKFKDLFGTLLSWLI